MSDFAVEWFSPVTTICLFVLLCLLWCYQNDKKLPPGSFGLPVIGETIALALKKADFFRERRRKYGDVFKTHLFLRPTVRVSGAENVQVILKGDKKIVQANHPKSVQVLMGSGALSQLTGPVHVIRKRNVIQSLTGENLESYIPIVAPIIEEAVGEWTRPESVDFCQEAKGLALHVVLSTLYGDALSLRDVESLCASAETVATNLFSAPINLPGTSFNKALGARRHLETFARTFVDKFLVGEGMSKQTPMIESLRKEMNNNDNPDMINILTDMSMELIIAGSSSMLSCVTNSVLLLARHRAVVSRLREELAAHSLDRPKSALLSDLSLTQLNRLTYLDQVLREVLRLFPPIGGSYRTATQSFHVNGYCVPKGWAVAFSIRETHENAAIPRCNEFDPDRWDPENTDRPDRQRYAYIPFGAGARSCPGRAFVKMVVKLILIQLCRSYDWSVLDSYKMVHYPTPVPDSPVRVKFDAQIDCCGQL